MKGFTTFILPMLVSFVSVSCVKANTDTNGITPDTTEIKGKKALVNPERGYHLESNYFIHNLKNPFHPYAYPKGWIDDQNTRFNSQADGITALQLYIYLTEYVGKDISADAFDNMQLLFDDIKKKGYKVILRFAYDVDYGSTTAAFSDVFRHLDQLEPFIKKNIGLIAIWQIGFIGAWGEGHSSPMTTDYVNRSRLTRRILDIFSDRQTTLRYPSQRNKLDLPAIYIKRMGYNNDYFTASEHPKAPGNDYIFNSPEYEQVKKESPYVQVMGEIPYAEATEWGLHSIISVPNTLKILRDHHYSLFDITQNNELNISHWKKFPLTAEQLRPWNILFDESYFMEAGKNCSRSAYDFIRDHLGYRFYIDTAATKYVVDGNNIGYSIVIKNTGFSAPHNPRPVYLLLIDDKNKIVQQQQLSDDPRNWQPFDVNTDDYKIMWHQIKGSITLSAKGSFKIGLWLPDPEAELQYIPSYSIQFANDGMGIWKDKENRYRVNIVGEVQVQ